MQQEQQDLQSVQFFAPRKQVQKFQAIVKMQGSNSTATYIDFINKYIEQNKNLISKLV